MTNQSNLWNAAAVLVASLTFATHGQDGVDSDSSWWGEITTDSAAVRCGANESYYPISFLTTGDTVRVVGKRQDWCEIVTEGSSFDGVVGYIKYPEKNIFLLCLDFIP